MMEYIQTNWQELAGIAGAIVLAASGIAALTPNKYDNKVMKALRGLVDLLALNVKNAKNQPK
jgi:hypothetical protein